MSLSKKKGVERESPRYTQFIQQINTAIKTNVVDQGFVDSETITKILEYLKTKRYTDDDKMEYQRILNSEKEGTEATVLDDSATVLDDSATVLDDDTTDKELENKIDAINERADEEVLISPSKDEEGLTSSLKRKHDEIEQHDDSSKEIISLVKQSLDEQPNDNDESSSKKIKLLEQPSGGSNKKTRKNKFNKKHHNTRKNKLNKLTKLTKLTKKHKKIIKMTKSRKVKING